MMRSVSVCVCVLTVCVLAMALEEPKEEKGILINLENGELCLNSLQCKSSCCHRKSGLSVARCAPQAKEKEECSPKTLYGTYYRCTCESGLRCDTDISIGGSVTNTNFGICRDPKERRSIPPKDHLQ